MNWEQPLKNMRELLSLYIKQNGLKSLVLGVSGGIDSALVAAIARPVCDDLGIPLIGRSLPNTTNKPDELLRAEGIGKSFCHDFKTYTINSQYGVLLNECETNYSEHEDERFNKIAEGNIKARSRMIYLYDLAYRNRGMVMGTDNLTELLVGFWTLHGDVGDYGLIQNLWKTEVYDLAIWMGYYDGPQCKSGDLLACVKAVPTDGLGITSSDLEQLGASTYAEVDKILKTWLTEDKDAFLWDECLNYLGRLTEYEKFLEYRESLKNHPVVLRHIKTEFKRTAPINLSRGQIFKPVEYKEAMDHLESLKNTKT